MSSGWEPDILPLKLWPHAIVYPICHAWFLRSAFACYCGKLDLNQCFVAYETSLGGRTPPAKRPMGIEPIAGHWQCPVLPLYHGRVTNYSLDGEFRNLDPSAPNRVLCL